jgi:hypothetical protein
MDYFWWPKGPQEELSDVRRTQVQRPDMPHCVSHERQPQLHVVASGGRGDDATMRVNDGDIDAAGETQRLAEGRE